MFLMKFCQHGSYFTQRFNVVPEYEREREKERERQRETERDRQRQRQRYTTLPPPLSKDEGVKDIGHSMSIKNLILGVNSVMVSYCLHREGEGVSEKANKGKQ